MRKKSTVTAAGKIALLWVGFSSSLILLLYWIIWSISANDVPAGVAVFSLGVALSVSITTVKFFHMFKKSKGLAPGRQDEWIFIVTVLAAAFAIGGAFQSVSNIGSQAISTSSCVSPKNVTIANCTQIQTTTLTQGPLLYFGQLGVWIVVLAGIGALAFGILYIVLSASQVG